MKSMHLKVEVPASKNQEFRQAVRELICGIRGQEGCSSCRFMGDMEVRNTYYLEVDWENRTHMQDYLHSDDFAVLQGAVKLLGVCHYLLVRDVQVESGWTPGPH